MRTRPTWLILALLLVSLSTTARADDHRADYDAGFGGASGSSIWGVHFATAVTLKKPKHHNLSLVADASFLWGGDNEEDLHGGFVGIRLATPWQEDQKVLPFVQVLVGASHQTARTNKPTGLTGLVGVGLDIIPNRHAMEENGEGGGGDGIRIQLDFVPRLDTKPHYRVMVGYLHRFEW